MVRCAMQMAALRLTLPQEAARMPCKVLLRKRPARVRIVLGALGGAEIEQAAQAAEGIAPTTEPVATTSSARRLRPLSNPRTESSRRNNKSNPRDSCARDYNYRHCGDDQQLQS